MKQAALFVFVLSLALPSVGCKSLLRKRQATDESPSATATVVAAPPVAAAPPAPPVAAPTVDVPTPEDFEDEAFEKITAQNFQAEFTRLKKEIEKP